MCKSDKHVKLFGMTLEYTAVFKKSGKWYVGRVEEVPGVNVQEKSLEEARDSLKDAISLVIETNRSLNKVKGQKIIKESIRLSLE